MAENDELLARWSSIAPTEDDQWRRLVPGPSVLSVAARLSGVPAEFLDDQVSVRALAGDVLGQHAVAAITCLDVARPPVRRGVALGLWLFAGEALLGVLDPPLSRQQPTLALDALGLRLAPVVEPRTWISDADRCEEATRTFLLWNGQLPAGETPDVARAALAARDSLQFNAALAASFAEQRHRDELRRRLEDARAREAAARYTSE